MAIFALTVRVRKNGANGNNVVQVTSSLTGQFEDSTHTDNLVSTDEVNYSQVTLGSSGNINYCSIAARILNTDPIALSLSDSMAVSDSRSRAVAVARSDSNTLVDARTFGVGLKTPASDGVSLSDVRVVGVTLKIGDTVTLVDEAQAVPGKILSFSDSVTTADVPSLRPGLFYSDGVSFSEGSASLPAVRKRVRLLKSDSVIVSDIPAMEAGLYIFDNIALSDSPSLLPGLGLSELLVVSDTLSKYVGKLAQDSIGLGEIGEAFIIGGPTPGYPDPLLDFQEAYYEALDDFS